METEDTQGCAGAVACGQGIASEYPGDLLCRAFRGAGERRGFERTEAEFVAFKELKVRWQRSYRWAEFKVSDYLADAPAPVLEGMADSLFARIAGEDDSLSYPKAMTDWITAPSFAESKQPVYLRRSRNLTRSPVGDKRSLSESLERLEGLGLAEADPSVHLSWTRESSARKVGHCSVLMKVVSISNALDSDMIPEYVLDFCLYHELCHIAMGFDPSLKRHGERFAEMESRYPRKADAEEWLKRLCMHL
ncbi:MAG: hypothetical protein LBG62_01280 [Candidatus Methanoplasma sp.]|jgi:hypothetical protein|nr:hypothetical protein [Candidatus Methanoplasma sp.]